MKEVDKTASHCDPSECSGPSVVSRRANLSLCFISWALGDEGVWGNRNITPQFFNSALDESKLSASRCGHFNSREIHRSTNWRGGWFVPKSSLKAEHMKFLFPPVIEHRFYQYLGSTVMNYKMIDDLLIDWENVYVKTWHKVLQCHLNTLRKTT